MIHPWVSRRPHFQGQSNDLARPFWLAERSPRQNGRPIRLAESLATQSGRASRPAEPPAGKNGLPIRPLRHPPSQNTLPIRPAEPSACLHHRPIPSAGCSAAETSARAASCSRGMLPPPRQLARRPAATPQQRLKMLSVASASPLAAGSHPPHRSLLFLAPLVRLRAPPRLRRCRLCHAQEGVGTLLWSFEHLNPFLDRRKAFLPSLGRRDLALRLIL